MAQHFLLSTKARTLSLAQVLRLSDQEAYDAFKAIRFADNGGEAAHWDAFHASYKTKRINHSEAYSTADGCTNMAESFFSRLRRAEIGTHHHIAGPYLAAYAAEMDWREDNRRVANGDQYCAIVSAAAKHPVSRQWKGYWQRRAVSARQE